jgi:N-acetylglucosaminyl-diphospho-decaprenol L-rhamnosyltransferase
VHYGEDAPVARLSRALAADPRLHVTIVDNSGDLQVPAGTRMRVLRPGANLGFARGVNFGARGGGAPWLLVLNPDLTISDAAISALQEALVMDSTLGLVGPSLENPDGSAQISGGRFTGWTRELARMTHVGPRIRVVRGRVRREARSKAAPHDVIPRDWITGAALMFRRAAWDDVGGFDERYFLYWEDEDICRRLRARGWRVAVVPKARARHEVGGSVEGRDPYHTPAFEESRVTYHGLHSGPVLKRLVRWHSAIEARRMAGS